MRFFYQKITIIQRAKPSSTNINEQLQWIGSSLGLFNLRDKDKSCFRIFIELVKASKRNKPMSSDDLAAKLNLSRGTVMHHMNKLMESGIVVVDKNKYMLRDSHLSALIDELKKDVLRACDGLREVSCEVDEELKMR